MAPYTLVVAALLAGVAFPAEEVALGPVDKVVTLLTEMQTSLQGDETTEQAAYDKFACWCEETSRKKVASITAAKGELKKLGQNILTLKGTVATRTDESDQAKADIQSNLDAQEQATTGRNKANKAWQDGSDEINSAMAGINNVMNVLVKATKPALLQQDLTASLRASMAVVFDTAPLQALTALEPEKLSTLRSFAQLNHNGQAGYAPQSGTIQGILSDMYTTMGVDLMESTAAEASQNHAFEDFIATKDGALNLLKARLTKKNKEKAEAASMLAESTEAYDDTSKQLEADVDLLDLTKKDCTAKTDAWTRRSSLRTEENSGIAEAIKILDDSEAKELFATAIKPGKTSGKSMRATEAAIGAAKAEPESDRATYEKGKIQLESATQPETEPLFLQVGSTTDVALSQEQHAKLETLYTKLKTQAGKSHSFRLASLAAQMRMAKAGHFAEVTKSIRILIGVLATEQDADTTKRNDCQLQYAHIAKTSNTLNNEIDGEKSRIKILGNSKTAFEDEEGDTVNEIAEVNRNIGLMKTQRETENAAFINAVRDDRSAIALLKSAKETMMAFYQNNSIDMEEIQGSVKRLADAQAPDTTFSNKGKRKNQAKGIVSIITMITEDLQAEVEYGSKAEEAAQLSYLKTTAAANRLVTKFEAKKQSFEGAAAKAQTDKRHETEDKTEDSDDFDAEQTTMADIKEECDFIIEKFSARRTLRAAESKTLSEAIEFLSNSYNPTSVETPALLQMLPARQSSFPSISFNHISSG